LGSNFKPRIPPTSAAVRSRATSLKHYYQLQILVPAQDGAVLLDGSKTMVTSAGEADSYVWSTRPLAAEGASTLWLVDSKLLK